MANAKSVLALPLRMARSGVREVMRRVYPPDVYFVSFAKAGRTWLRAFLAKYVSLEYGVPLSLEFANFRKQHPAVPRILFTHAGHDSPNPNDILRNINRLCGSRVIYLARDPRDVVVSYYFQRTKRSIPVGHRLPDNWTEIPVAQFLRHEAFGIQRIVDHMNAWYSHRDSFQEFLLLRYEDCKEDTRAEFTEMLAFLGFKDIKPEVIEEALAFSSFDNMKKMERQEGFDRVKPADATDPESFKVRKGKVGGYREYLDDDDIRFADQHVGRLDPAFGYVAGER